MNYVIVAVVSFIAGAVVTFLVARRNPNKVAVLNQAVSTIAK